MKNQCNRNASVLCFKIRSFREEWNIWMTILREELWPVLVLFLPTESRTAKVWSILSTYPILLDTIAGPLKNCWISLHKLYIWEGGRKAAINLRNALLLPKIDRFRTKSYTSQNKVTRSCSDKQRLSSESKSLETEISWEKGIQWSAITLILIRMGGRLRRGLFWGWIWTS